MDVSVLIGEGRRRGCIEGKEEVAENAKLGDDSASQIRGAVLWTSTSTTNLGSHLWWVHCTRPLCSVSLK